MELTAALEVLSSLKGRQRVEIRTDSLFLIQVCEDWMAGWKARGWRKQDREPVANLDLVRTLDEFIHRHDVVFNWIRGHAGEPGNEYVDRMLNRAMDALRSGSPASGERRLPECPLGDAQQVLLTERSSGSPDPHPEPAPGGPHATMREL
jgi:ribonuclease HI